MTKNRSTGLIALILGLCMGYGASQLPPSTIIGDVGPAVFPFVSAVMLVICGLGLIITGGKKEGSPFDEPGSGMRLLKIFSSVLLYVIAMCYLGFVAPTVVILYVLESMFAEGKSVKWWVKVIYAVVITAAIYFLFRRVLNLKLPTNKLF